MSTRYKETKLIKFIKRAYRIIRRARVPFRNSKFSNHIFNNYVHLIFLTLRALSGMSYQRFLEWIENFEQILVILRIERFPHFTTLQKFASRIDKRYLDILIVISSTGPNIRILMTAIDSTGFSLTNASYQYITTIDRYREKGTLGRPRTKRKVRRYLKPTFVGEIRSQMILAVKIRRGPDNDSKDFIPAYKKVKNLDHRKVKLALGDKGFDAEPNHKFIREDIGGRSIIPIRKYKAMDYTTRGKYRREMRAGYPKELYSQRSKMETINSVIKRKMGGSIRAFKCKLQNREIMFKALAYNLERGLLRYYIRGFLESSPPYINPGRHALRAAPKSSNPGTVIPMACRTSP